MSRPRISYGVCMEHDRCSGPRPAFPPLHTCMHAQVCPPRSSRFLHNSVYKRNPSMGFDPNEIRKDYSGYAQQAMRATTMTSSRPRRSFSSAPPDLLCHPHAPIITWLPRAPDAPSPNILQPSPATFSTFVLPWTPVIDLDQNPCAMSAEEKMNCSACNHGVVPDTDDCPMIGW